MSLKILIGLLAAVVVTGAGVVGTYGNPFDTDLGPSPCSMKASASAMPLSEGDSCCAMMAMPSCCSSETEVAQCDDATMALVGGTSMVACDVTK